MNNNRLHKFIAGALMTSALISPVMGQEVDEIIVSATGIPTPAAQIGASVDIITAQDLKQKQITYLQDALSTVAGISTYSSGGTGTTSNVFMRGLSGNYSGVYVDGVQINDPVSQQASWAYLPTHGLASVEVLRGSQGVLYGSEAIGGAISLFTAYGGETQNTASIETGALGTNIFSLSSQGQRDNLGYGVFVQKTDTDGISAANEENGNVEEDGYESLTARARFVLDVTDQISLDLALRSISSEVETDEFSFGLGVVDDPNAYTDFDAVGGRLAVDYKDDGAHHRLSIGESQDVTSSYGTFPSTTTGERSLISYRGVFDVATNTKALFGLESETDTYIATTNTYEADTEAVYALVQYADENALSASVSVRQDEHDNFGSFETYRLAGRKMFGDIGFRASYGTGFRAPSLFENFGESPFCAGGVCGDLTLQPEESESADIAVIFAPNKAASFELAYFKIDISDIIEYRVDRYVQSDGESQSSGYELRGRYDVDAATTISGNFTALDAETPTGARDIRRPEKTLNLSVTRDFSDRVSGNANLLMVKDVIDTDFATFPSQQVTLDDYALLNMAVSFAITDKVKWSARLNNVLDDAYETTLGYGTPGRTAYVGLTANF